MPIVVDAMQLDPHNPIDKRVEIRHSRTEK